MQAMTSPRVSTPTRTSGKGNQWWRRDVHHIAENGRTLCGRDASDWLPLEGFATIDDAMASPDCCKQCVRHREAA